jgi:hypothetical protein
LSPVSYSIIALRISKTPTSAKKSSQVCQSSNPKSPSYTGAELGSSSSSSGVSIASPALSLGVRSKFCFCECLRQIMTAITIATMAKTKDMNTKIVKHLFKKQC